MEGACNTCTHARVNVVLRCAEIPSFKRRENSRRTNVAIATGILAGAVLWERYNGGISRTAKSLRR